MSKFVDTASVLAIKIDFYSNKLFLFDIVEEKYHLIAVSETQSTANMPFNDVREGVIQALEKIRQITGRRLVDEESNLIIPSTADGSGFDQLAIVYGFHHEVKAIAMGLLEDVSLDSATKLIKMSQVELVDSISMNDDRKIDNLMSLFFNKQPDIIFLSGGTEHGASKSILKLLEVLHYATSMIPIEKKPEVIFAGNSQMADKVKSSLTESMKVYIAPNIRPAIETENLPPASALLGKVSTLRLMKKIAGFQSLATHCETSPVQFTQAAKTMVQFLSNLNEQKNSVLYLDLNKEFLFSAVSSNNGSEIDVSDFSLSHKFDKFVKNIDYQEIKDWSPIHHEAQEVKSYLWNRTIFNHYVPITETQLSLETSIIKKLIQKHLSNLSPDDSQDKGYYNQVILSGDIFSNFLNFVENLNIILDSVQPKGVTGIFFDQHGILPALGAIAQGNKFLPVHILETSAILLLARVITIQSSAKFGTKLAHITVDYEDGNTSDVSISKGDLVQLSIPSGQSIRIQIEPNRGIRILPRDNELFDKGIILQGGMYGVIIDARGRPISLPKEDSRRRAMLNKWRSAFSQ